MIPLIIPNFNQLTYLVNLITWWNYYTGDSTVHILDNNSTYPPLLKYYHQTANMKNVHVYPHKENNCGNNLREFIDSNIKGRYEYYCISNPDIMPHPATPEFFLDIFKECIDRYQFHHAGFRLIINDFPGYIDNKELILFRENKFWTQPVNIEYDKIRYKGFIAPLDLTFCMYTTKNSGWYYPMERPEWNNSIRILDAFHLGWYIHPNTSIEETKYYFKTCLKRSQTHNIKGVNNYKPSTL